jgi:hypothetical protein
MHEDEKGKVWAFQEALGYLIGTVVEATPLCYVLGDDAVWVRNMGAMSDAMRTGHVQECHALPGVQIERHAVRYKWPWPHKAPRP